VNGIKGNQPQEKQTPMSPSEYHSPKPEDVHQRYRVIAGNKILFDKEGFLWHFEDWNEDLAVVLARECGIERLRETHWRVLTFMRDFFGYHGRAPMNRDLKKGTGMSIMEIEKLFPQGIRRGARKIAGLPNPRTCTG
jgi:tRNA 2-thiouridine synthesizing protein E